MTDALIILSGGLDSTTALAHSISKGHQPAAISFVYPSKHNAYELKAACAVVQHYGIRLFATDIGPAFAWSQSALLLSGGDIPQGHYNDESMKATVVPGRNLIMISVAASLAESQGFRFLVLGIHAGDHAIYPDCRPMFYRHARAAVRHSTDGAVDLYAPFIDQDKAAIVREGLRLKAPYELTRTCYQGQDRACGVCGSCVERREAFAENGTEDPLPYVVDEVFGKGGGSDG